MRPQYLAIILLLACSLPAATPQVAALGGSVTSVAAANGEIFASSGARLLRFAPDPASPSGYTESGATAPLPDLVRAVTVQDGRAWVAAGTAGIYLYDVSAPGAPVPVSSLATCGHAEGVIPAGKLALVAAGPLGLRILDFSDPARPAELAYAFEGRQAMAVAFRDHYALVAAGGAGLLIADLADPAHPIETASVPLDGFASGIALTADFAYVMDSWGGIAVVDISKPAQPALRATVPTPGWAVRGTAFGTFLAVADAYRGARLLDISDPIHPTEAAASESLLGDAADIAFNGSTLWIADRHDGLRALTVPTLAAKTVYAPFSRAWSVAISGNYAYVAAAEHGLRIVDISNPDRPRELGVYPVCNAAGVTVNYPYVYLSVFFGGDTSGFHVVDVSDPAHPKRMGFLATVNDLPMNVPRDHDSVGTLAYVTNETGLIVIDAADPANPVVAGFVAAPPGGPTLGVTVRNRLAYVAQESGGVQIFDVSDPHSPKLLSSSPASSFSPQDVAVSGDYAFAAGMGGASVVDISDPAHPSAVPVQLSPGRGVFVAGSQAFYATAGGVQLWDISNPRVPVPTASYRTPGYPRKAIPQGDRIWIADAETGLWSVPIASMSPIATQTAANQPTQSPALLHSLSHASPPPIAQPRTLRPRLQARDGSEVSSCVVSNRGDVGPDTLRGCLEAAAPGATITFDPAVFPPSTPGWIMPITPLPPLSQGGITIDASSAGVVIEGRLLGSSGTGLVIQSDGNTIQGLTLQGFQNAAILVTGARNTIGGDRTQGSGPNGKGNRFWGGGIDVGISGAGATSNTVAGNYFKTTADGLKPTGFMGRAGDYRPCIGILDGAQANTIGGTTPGLRNVVGACAWPAGVLFSGDGTTDNVMIGNYIGVSAAGGAFACDFQPCHAGQILIQQHAARNHIGGTAPGEGNVISSAVNCGICLSDFGTVDNTIAGNYIGTDAAGATCLGNVNFGIWLDGGASRTSVMGNVVCGVDGPLGIGGDYNTIVGNLINTDPTRKRAFNGQGGILTANIPTRRNRIQGNLVAATSSGPAISLSAPATESNYVIANVLGTIGTAAGNLGAVLNIWDGTKRNTIGGSVDAEANTITSGGGNGVNFGLEGVSSHFLGANTITGNSGDGISVGAADHTYILRNRIFSNSRMALSNWTGFATTVRLNSIHDNGGGIMGPRQSTPMPSIRLVTDTTVYGSACASCLVDIYSDAGNQGAWFEGSVRANAAGTFLFTKPDGFRGPNLTATATSADGLTSSFSPPAGK